MIKKLLFFFVIYSSAAFSMVDSMLRLPCPEGCETTFLSKQDKGFYKQCPEIFAHDFLALSSRARSLGKPIDNHVRGKKRRKINKKKEGQREKVLSDLARLTDRAQECLNICWASRLRCDSGYFFCQVAKDVLQYMQMLHKNWLKCVDLKTENRISYFEHKAREMIQEFKDESRKKLENEILN